MTLAQIAEVDSFFIQQQFSFISNRYRIATLGSDGQSEGTPVAEVRQKRLKIREHIDFTDPSGKEQLLEIKARKVFEFRGRSEVRLPDGTVIGQLQKVFGASLLRSTWQLLDAQGNEVATASESSQAMALLRRGWGFIPVVGEVPFMLPFHFDISIAGQKVGTYRRIWAIRDRYVMDLQGDTSRRIDRRVAIAWAIALDALQDR